MLGKLNRYLTKLGIFLTIAALIVGMAGCDGYTPPSQDLEIRDWYDLDAVRNNLDGDYILMNDLDSTIAGYEGLAGPTAKGGKGWQPIGSIAYNQSMELVNPFIGTFGGQGYEIRDLFIDRPDEFGVGLFGAIEGGVIKNVEVMNANVTGLFGVGILAGGSASNVSNSYSTGIVSGTYNVGGLVGVNYEGTVSNSYSTGSVSGVESVGGLVGGNAPSGTVGSSYSTGSVTGYGDVGGLVGLSLGTVSNSYSTGSVSGHWGVGGLLGHNDEGTVSNSYSTGSVTGDKYVGGLVGWNDHAGTVTNSYSNGSVSGNENVGGLVGYNHPAGTVSYSFWDTETSGQAASAGGTGKNTTEMKNIDTFSGAGWNIIIVGGPGERNPAYIWNIVDDETYPFLSWQ